MAVVREASRERRAIVEGIVGSPFRQLNLALKSVCERTGFCYEEGMLRTWRSKALSSRHLVMMASSSLGKSIDMVDQFARRSKTGRSRS